MLEIIDLSQEIYSGMPVFPGLPQVSITVHASHEQLDGVAGSDVVSPAVNRLGMGFTHYENMITCNDGEVA